MHGLRTLAAKYKEVELEKFLDGREELLRLGFDNSGTIIPAGLCTDILFRDVYAGMLGIIRAGANKRQAMIFSGTAGTGKSAGALVVACDFARKRQHFMHRSTDAALGEVWIYMDFRKDTVRVDYATHGDEHFNRFRALLASDSTVTVIWDGQMKKGQYHHERSYIVLTSPNEGNYHDFMKGGVPLYCVDIWTLRDILRALPLFPHVTQDEAVQRYREFGGSIRDVLANAHVPGHTFHAKVELAMSSDVLDCLCSLRPKRTSSDLPHRFVHMRAGPDMLFRKYVMASPAVRNLAYQNNVEKNKRSQRRLVLTAPAGVHAYAGWRGCMLEEVGHELLPGTLMVTVQPCKTPTREEAIKAAHAAAKRAATGAEAAVAAQAAQAMEQMPPATAAITALRRSKRRRAAATDSHAQQMQGVLRVEEAQAMVEEMEAELEDHHAMPPPDAPGEGEGAAAVEEQVQQQLAATPQLQVTVSGEQQVEFTSPVPRVWDYPGLNIRDMPQYYLQPTSASNGGWDAVRKCPKHLWILQYTISEWHGTRAQSILDLLDRFSDEDRARAILVYGVPDDVYKGYLKQPWLTVGKKRMKVVPQQLQRMTQLVLKMPLASNSRNSSADGT